MSYRNRLPLGQPSAAETYRAMAPREQVFFWIATVNFVVFVAVAVPLGGISLNGGVRGGHYFLMLGGVYTEVSRPIFIYSTIHSISVIITWPIVAAMWLKARFRRRAAAGPS